MTIELNMWHLIEAAVIVVALAAFLIKWNRQSAEEHRRQLEVLEEIRKADAAFHNRVLIALNVFEERLGRGGGHPPL